MLLGVSRGLLNRPHHQGGLQVAFRGPSMLAGLEADDTCIRLFCGFSRVHSLSLPVDSDAKQTTLQRLTESSWKIMAIVNCLQHASSSGNPGF